MIDDVVAAEWQLDEQHRLAKHNGKANRPGAEGQLQAEAAGHDGGVAKGLADGQVTVKGHAGEDEELGGAQEEVEEGLQQAARGADRCSCHHKGFQQFRDDRGGVPGQVAEEEVYWSLQSGLSPDKDNNEPIACQGEYVDHGEDRDLEPMDPWKAEENELCDGCAISHVP